MDKLGIKAFLPNYVQTPESLIITHMAVAEQLGNRDQRAKELAVEYNKDIREVYEIWFSPEVHLP